MGKRSGSRSPKDKKLKFKRKHSSSSSEKKEKRNLKLKRMVNIQRMMKRMDHHLQWKQEVSILYLKFVEILLFLIK
jgi:hypothetical protein